MSPLIYYKVVLHFSNVLYHQGYYHGRSMLKKKTLQELDRLNVLELIKLIEYINKQFWYSTDKAIK